MTTARPPAKTTPPPAAGTVGTDLDLVKSGKWLKFLTTYEQDLSRVAPSHIKIEAFLGLAAAYIRSAPVPQEGLGLAKAVQLNPASLIYALRRCAMLGHVPDPDVFALVPFAGKRPGVVGIETYRGVIQRFYRAGGVRSVDADVVRENDHCRFQRTRMALPDHTYDEFATDEIRGPLKAAYAWARMMDGSTSRVSWMPRHEVMKHRAMSRSGDAFWGPPWPKEGPWTVAMWLKTACLGLEPWVPHSAEYRWQLAVSGAAATTGFAGVPSVGITADVEEAEIVDDRGSAQDRPEPSAQSEAADGSWPDTPRPPDWKEPTP